MSIVHGSQSEKTLFTSLAHKAISRNMCIAFAKQAKKDGYIQIQAILEETATHIEALSKRLVKRLDETHGANVSLTLGDVSIGTTQKNLEKLIAHIAYDNSVLTPAAIDAAIGEEQNQLAALNRAILVAEQFHERRLRKLADNINNGTVFKSDTKIIWHCRKCGYICEGLEPPERCPACNHPRDYFERLPENW